MLRLAFFLIPTLAISQDGHFEIGARNHAIAGTSVTISDPWAVFNNPGALGSYEHSSVVVSYQNRFNLEGFHVIGGGAIYHHKLFNLAAKYFKFGDHYYNQQLLGLVIANRFQMVSLGIGVNVIQTHIESVNTKRVWVGEFGGTAQLTKQLFFGAHLFNFKHGTRYPTTMKVGLSFRPEEILKLNLELEKQLEQKSRLKAGLEYAIIERFLLRTGVSLQENDDYKTTVLATFGLGFRPGNFICDYAFSSQELGPIHELSITYQLPNNRP